MLDCLTMMWLYYTVPEAKCNHGCITQARRARHEVLSYWEVLSEFGQLKIQNS
jgi:hypothetical protein